MSAASYFFGPTTTRQGPSPTFGSAHLLLAFMTVGENGSIGRAALARRCGLGGGAVRTVLKNLRSMGFVASDASGSHLTGKGREALASVRRRLSVAAVRGESGLTIGEVQVAAVVRGARKKVRRGIEQRDSAIRIGASGATTYVIRNGRFTIPGGSADCERDYPSAEWGELRGKLDPAEGDAVVVCGSEEVTSATLGALSASLTLL